MHFKQNKKTPKEYVTVHQTVSRGGHRFVETRKKAIGVDDDLPINERQAESYRKTYNRKFLTVMLCLLIFAVIFIIASQNRSVQFDKQTITIPGLSPDLEGYTILFISDMNAETFGENQATILRDITSKASYSAVVLGGDMVGRGGNAEPLYQLVEGLGTKKPIYFCCGDSDPGPYLEKPRDGNGTLTLSQTVLAEWIVRLQDMGCTFVDSPVKFSKGSGTIWFSPVNMLNINSEALLEEMTDQKAQEEEGTLLGLDADHNTLPLTTYRFMLANRLANAAAEMSAEDIHIVISHIPPADSVVETSQIGRGEESGLYLNAPDLFLSGHYCGGVWRVPLMGPLYIPSTLSPRNGWFPSFGSAQGLRTINGASVYITGGLSTTSSVKLPFRLFNSPQISLITLSGQLPESILR